MPAINWLAGALLVGASAIYDLGTLSASVPRWLIVYAWACAACFLFAWRVWVVGFKGIDRIDLMALVLLSWAALSLSWSSDWRQGVLELTNCIALCAVFMYVRRNPDGIQEAALVAVFLAVFLHALAPEDWGGHGNRNFQTEMIVLALCISFARKHLMVWLLAFGAAAWLLLLENPSKAEFVAVAGILLWKLYDWRNAPKLNHVAA